MTNQPGNERSPNGDQSKQEKPFSQITNVALIGFIGGLFWSALGQLAYYFSFTEIGPKVIISGWASDRWRDGVLGGVVTIVLCGLLSIIVALIYYALLRKVNNLLICMLFGVGIWAIVHMAFIPFFPNLMPIKSMNMNTLVTTLCIYILYGVFIGISISFDESERKRMKEQEEITEVQS